MAGFLTHEQCKQIIDKCVRKNCEVTDCELTQLEKDGIMGSYYRLKISANAAGNEITRNFFVKWTQSELKCQEDMIRQQGAFEKEYFVYEILFREYAHQLISPECYLTIGKEVIVLEDLNVDGYSAITDFAKGISIEETRAVVKTLAQYHAASIVFEKKRGEGYRLLDEYPQYFTEPLYRSEPAYPGAKMWKVTRDTVLSLMDLSPLFTDVKDAKKIFKEIADELGNATKASDNELNVCTHGDLWYANFLFKRTPGEEIRCKIVDFQAIRYCTPALDVSSLIDGLINHDIREHNPALQDLYYFTLKDLLASNSIELEQLMTHEAFLHSCEKIKPYIVAQKSMMWTISLISLRPDLKKNPELFSKFLYDDREAMVLQAYKEMPIFKMMMDQMLKDLKSGLFSS